MTHDAGLRPHPKLAIISCACGRIETFKRHIEALANQVREVDESAVEYCVGIWGDPAEQEVLLGERGEAFCSGVQTAHVETDKYWPLPLAYNAALGLARGARALVIGSDIIAPPGTLRWAAEQTDGDAHFTACLDEGGDVFQGPTSKGAFPYCMSIARERLLEIGGWDEIFAEGIVFDDVDLSARLLMSGLSFHWNFDIEAVHQTHAKSCGQGTPASWATRSQHKGMNYAELLCRLGRIPVDEIWPLWWPENHKPGMPCDDGLEIQQKLRARLIEAGYPQQGDWRR